MGPSRKWGDVLKGLLDGCEALLALFCDPSGSSVPPRLTLLSSLTSVGVRAPWCLVLSSLVESWPGCAERAGMKSHIPHVRARSFRPFQQAVRGSVLPSSGLGPSHLCLVPAGLQDPPVCGAHGPRLLPAGQPSLLQAVPREAERCGVLLRAPALAPP